MARSYSEKAPLHIFSPQSTLVNYSPSTPGKKNLSRFFLRIPFDSPSFISSSLSVHPQSFLQLTHMPIAPVHVPQVHRLAAVPMTSTVVGRAAAPKRRRRRRRRPETSRSRSMVRWGRKWRQGACVERRDAARALPSPLLVDCLRVHTCVWACITERDTLHARENTLCGQVLGLENVL